MTMTLDELKEAVADICAGCDSERSLFTNADLGDAIDAAIREQDELRTGRDAWAEQHASRVLELVAARERAVKAEAELAALKNENAQLRDVLADRDMDREVAAHANKELAALKARIDGSRHAFLGPNMDRITFLAEDIGPVGKYALVKVED